MTLHRIAADFSAATSIDDLAAAIARQRGCATEQEVAEFLEPRPVLANPLARVARFDAVRQFLDVALERGEPVLIYGDYDCDGVTSITIMRDLLLAGGLRPACVHCFAPNRFEHKYGLTEAGLAAAAERHAFRAVIAVDCGSPSRPEIRRLGAAGIPTLVIDHHDIATPGAPHPAAAHFNPKDFPQGTPCLNRLRAMSAAGLTFLVADAYAAERRLSRWNRDRAVILGGLGTLVDVMPLTGFNRILVKQSLALAERSQLQHHVPGLYELKRVAKTAVVNEETYGFQWGPRINAAGRLADPMDALRLLIADQGSAPQLALAVWNAESEPAELAEALDLTNGQRRDIQADILAAAQKQAEAQLAQPAGARILVLHDASWHTGVVGIVASKIREAYYRPAILFGRTPRRSEPWAGSGRSIAEYNLGAAVFAAREAGHLLRGGGHPMAAGMAASDEGQIERLRAFLDSQCQLDTNVFRPIADVLGPWNCFGPVETSGLLQRLRPFGAGNPEPLLVGNDAEVTAVEDKSRCTVVTLKTREGALKVRARGESWTVGQILPGVLLQFERGIGTNGRVFYHWNYAGTLEPTCGAGS